MKLNVKNKELLTAIYTLGQVEGGREMLEGTRSMIKDFHSDDLDPRKALKEMDSAAESAIEHAAEVAEGFLDEIEELDSNAYELIQDFRKFSAECDKEEIIIEEIAKKVGEELQDILSDIFPDAKVSVIRLDKEKE